MKKRTGAEKRKNPFRYFLYDFTYITGAIPVWLWMRPKFHYASEAAKARHKGGVLFAVNHTELTDPVKVLAAIPYRRLHFLVLKQILDRKILGKFLRAFLAIPVDRDNFDLATFRTVSGLLKDGKAVVIFPEGAINVGEEPLAAYKSGVVMMAEFGGAPIVPIWIAPRAHWYERLHVVIGDPVMPKGAPGGLAPLGEVEAGAAALRETELELKRLYEKSCK